MRELVHTLDLSIAVSTRYLNRVDGFYLQYLLDSSGRKIRQHHQIVRCYQTHQKPEPGSQWQMLRVEADSLVHTYSRKRALPLSYIDCTNPVVVQTPSDAAVPSIPSRSQLFPHSANYLYLIRLGQV